MRYSYRCYLIILTDYYYYCYYYLIILLIYLYNKILIPWNKTFVEKVRVPHLTKNVLPFIEPQVSLQHSHELATWDYIMMLCSAV
jgi:hypothetical protein